LESLVSLEEQALRDREERMDQRVQLENLEILDNRVCQVWLESQVLLENLDLQVLLVKVK